MTPLIKEQRGASLLAAIFLMVVVAFFGAVVVSLVTTQSFTSLNELQSTRALYVAEGGLERATRALLAPPLAERVSCAAVTGSASLTDKALGDGRFTVTRDALPFYPAPAATLDATIGKADTSIQVSSTAGYAQTGGRIMIDRELIDYTGVLAGPPRFTGAKRGAGGTSAVDHAATTRVAQYQCSVTSQGGVADLASPTGRRVVAQGVQLEGGWAGGKANNDGNELFRWNGTDAPNAWGRASSVVQEISAVDMLSYADGWAVGKKNGNDFNIARWDGAAWVQIAAGVGDDLAGVSMLSSTQGWAVGKAGIILHWDGVSWHRNHHAEGVTDKDLKSISMVSPISGWIVGKAGTIVHWDGVSWHTNHHAASPTAEDLEDVYIGSPTAGWIVGKAAAGILHWDGATWHRNDAHSLLTTTDDLKSVHMVSATTGWAVGKNGVIYHYESASAPAWHAGDAHSTSPTGQDLTAVFMLSPINGWAVGKGGVIIHWDSATWGALNNSPTTQDLKGLSMVVPGDPPQAVWREVFN